jgi:hypothetical protein
LRLGQKMRAIEHGRADIGLDPAVEDRKGPRRLEHIDAVMGGVMRALGLLLAPAAVVVGGGLARLREKVEIVAPADEARRH